MSRIGNTPVVVPEDVNAGITGGTVTFKTAKGELTVSIPPGISLHQEGNLITAKRTRNDRKVKALHGLVVSLMKNAITGVTTGWTKRLELSGVGYRATLSGTDLVLTVGFSHPVTISPPQGIAFEIKESKIIVSGIDKYLVGQVAASIRAVKPPEPYKGKGIKYFGEHIRRKAGKSAKAVGGGSAGGAK